MWNIRPLVLTDIDSVNAIVGSHPSHPGFSWNKELLLNEFKQAKGFCLLDERGLVVSFAFYRSVDQGDKFTADITCLATLQAQAHKGAMSNLLKQIFIAESHIDEWWLEVHEKNLPAIFLYSSLGFVQMRTRLAYYRDGSAALIFKKDSLKSVGS